MFAPPHQWVGGYTFSPYVFWVILDGGFVSITPVALVVYSTTESKVTSLENYVEQQISM
jgi:hypothetical protein